MTDLLELIGALGVGLLIVVVVVIVPVHFIEKSACQNYAQMLEMEYNHQFPTGCVIKTEKGWIKSNKYIINKEGK